MKFIFFAIINLIYSVDKRFRIIEIMDFNRTGPTCCSTIFLMTVRANKMELFHTDTTPYIHLMLDSQTEPKFSNCPVI